MNTQDNPIDLRDAPREELLSEISRLREEVGSLAFMYARDATDEAIAKQLEAENIDLVAFNQRVNRAIRNAYRDLPKAEREKFERDVPE